MFVLLCFFIDIKVRILGFRIQDSGIGLSNNLLWPGNWSLAHVGTFLKIRRIQTKIYPQSSIEPKYGTFYLNSKVRVYGLVLLVQLSQRVASPWYMQYKYKIIYMKNKLQRTHTQKIMFVALFFSFFKCYVFGFLLLCNFFPSNLNQPTNCRHHHWHQWYHTKLAK